MIGLLRRLWRDESGIILPYVTVMLVVIVGVSMLALDGARYMNLQSQMQAAADAMALAGAAELNKQAGARARALAAIDNLAVNGLSAMGITTPVAHQALQFYETLPNTDDLAMSSGTLATSDETAFYVSVTAQPVTIPTILPVRFLNPSGVNSITAGATAVGGYLHNTICGMPPVFICNPYEGMGVSLHDAFNDKTILRRQLRLLNGYGGPGQFGYLIPPDGCNGASCLSDWISRTNPVSCYRDSGVDLNTGNMASVSAAFNVRLDIKQGSLTPDPNHAPDVNVRKGSRTDGPQTNKLCTYNPVPSTDTTIKAVPDDSAFPLQGGSLGNGIWNCPAYWTANYGGTPPAKCRNDAGTPTDPSWTRYDLYNYEIENGSPHYVDRWSGNRATPPPYNATTGEKGAPVCGMANGTNGVRDRRIIFAAIINCASVTIPPGGTANNIPVAGFGKFFITRPIGNDNNMYGEITGGVTLDEAGATVRRQIQLYR